MKLCVIPARGGSKRIPRKNIRAFCGKPMISWSIAAAQRSGLFDRIIVSTDDNEIAGVSREYGAEAPFERPADLSDDHAGTTDVIAHATRWCVDHGDAPEAVCCIYATAPFVQVSDLQAGWDALQTGGWLYAFSVTEYGSPIFRSFERKPDGSVEMFFPEKFQVRSQDLPVAYHDAAQFYWGRPQAWMNGERIFDAHSYAVPVPRWRVQDIDEPDDWARAELMFKLLQKEGLVGVGGV